MRYYYPYFAWKETGFERLGHLPRQQWSWNMNLNSLSSQPQCSIHGKCRKWIFNEEKNSNICILTHITKVQLIVLLLSAAVTYHKLYVFHCFLQKFFFFKLCSLRNAIYSNFLLRFLCYFEKIFISLFIDCAGSSCCVGFSLAVMHGATLQLRYAGFSLWCLLVFQSLGSRVCRLQ